jgi:enoyl-CoA hydratase/carnithine racemase
MEPLLLSTKEGPVLTLTINRPEKLNCINMEILSLLDSHIADLEKDNEIKVVVLRGAGDRSFSTGGDLNIFNALKTDEVITWIRYGNTVFNRLESLIKPTVAVIQGYAFGGGLELALACDFRITYDNAVFGMPEIGHGWLPGWGGMARLKRLVGESRTKEIVMLADRFGANVAYNMGLVHRIAVADKIDVVLSELTDNLCKKDTKILGFAKSVINNPHTGTADADMALDIMATYYSKFIPDKNSV